MLHPSRVSVRRPVVTQSRALSRDSRFECSTNAPVERACFGVPKLIRGPARVDPRPPERLVGVDIPHAGERPLVEENAFNRGTTPGEPLAEIASGKARPERLDAQTRCEIWRELVRPEDELRSKTPDVAVCDDRPVV